MQAWLHQEGLQDLLGTFTSNNIDGAELSRLNKDTAAELGIGEAGNTERSHEGWRAAHAHGDAGI